MSCVSQFQSTMNSPVTWWSASMTLGPPESFHFPKTKLQQRAHPSHSPDWHPAFFSSYTGQGLIPDRLSPVLNSLCPHPEACCQHSLQHSAYTTQLRWEGFFLLPSSKIVKCFLLDQRTSKLVNHTTNAAVARQLPTMAVRTLPANRRCNLLLQAVLSIIPDINHQAWTKRPL